jgi:hypothetical protein
MGMRAGFGTILVMAAAVLASSGSARSLVGSGDVHRAATLEGVVADIAKCKAAHAPGNPFACAGIVYFWSPGMPLSETGIAEIEAASRSLDLALHVVQSSELRQRAPSAMSDASEALAKAMTGAGATLHEPALVVHRGGVLIGGAILGYKTADAYRSLIEERLVIKGPGDASASARRPAAPGEGSAASIPSDVRGLPEPTSYTDLPARGQPGAYFRWVPGRNAVAYESVGVVYLLDLEGGGSRAAPGFVDFVPTPDGRYFVTPGRTRALEFYDAAEVFEAAQAGRGREVRPFYVDDQMQDQYPSVGILSTEQSAAGSRTVYRVLTSWYDRIAFRDYEVRVRAQGGRALVRPLGGPVEACAGYRFSIPIMSQSGLEVAGRDEATATTKVLRIGANGRCTEAADIGLPTGKVAWSPDGRRVAFAIPAGAVSDGSGVVFRGDDDATRAGVFVYDLQTKAVTKVEASEQNRRLTFPEFVGNDRVTFLLPGERPGQSNRFRLVCCLR